MSEVLALRVLQMLQQMYLLGHWELVRQGWLHARSQTGPHPQSLPHLCDLACKPGVLIIVSVCSLGVPWQGLCIWWQAAGGVRIVQSVSGHQGLPLPYGTRCTASTRWHPDLPAEQLMQYTHYPLAHLCGRT